MSYIWLYPLIAIQKMNFTYTVFKSYGVPPNYATMTAVSVILSIIDVVGVVANVLTIVVIAKFPKLTSMFNVLIMSLCFSDLISASIGSIRIYCFNGAYFETKFNPKNLCKFAWRMTNWMTFNSAMHICFFAFLRFSSTTCIRIYNKFNISVCKVIIVATWIVTGIFGFAVVYIEPYRVVRVAAYSAVYMTMTLTMIVLSTGTAIRVLMQRKNRVQMTEHGGNISEAYAKQTKKENGYILQLALIVGSFCFGYLPRAVFSITVLCPASPEEQNARWWFAFAQYACLRISESLNPLFYNIASTKLRQATRNALKNWWRTLKNLPGDHTINASDDPSNERS